MSRPLRIEYPGALYHVTARGNRKEKIYLSEYDRKFFLKILESVIDRYHWVCYAYCLMDNHYHLLIETPDANLSRGMRQLNGVYTQKFNWLHDTVGHIFQGRYKAYLIDKESYFLEVLRYIVLNPVRAGFVKDPSEFEWSSFTATVRSSEKPFFLSIDRVLRYFSENENDAIRLYKEFVLSGIGKESPWKELRGVVLGHERFVEEVENRIKHRGDPGEISKAERFVAKPELSEIFFGLKSKDDRNRRIIQAVFKSGYSSKEVSDYLGIHYSTVSKILGSGLES